MNAEQMIRELLSLPLQIIPVSHLLPKALQIALNYQLAVYDAVYIALALDLDCPLITVDAQQCAAARVVGAVLKPITEFS